MKHTAIFKLIVLSFLLVLTSCASINEKVTSQPDGWSAERQKRLQVNNWIIRGRLGVQTETTGGTVDIIWKQVGQDFSIRFIAPLGSGTYHIQGDNRSAEVRYPDGSKEVIGDVDNIFTATLDVDLPAHAIKDWIRGLPAKSLPIDDINWNEQGLLNTVKQSGWNIEMKKYLGNDVLMPHAIYISKDDREELDIRLVLRQWDID